MEISPVPGIRAFTAAKTQPADFQLSALLDIDDLAPPGNSGRTGDRKKASGAEEMDGDDLFASGDAVDYSPDAPPASINFFA
jgi:hypothetical protein